MAIKKRRSDRSGRDKAHSPGRPPVAGRREHETFWALISAGQSSEDAATSAGVSPAVGTRWFRRAGGMPPSHFSPSSRPLTGRYLTLPDREEIALLRIQGHGVCEIARRLGRSASTISRELRRNAATRGGGLEYRATTAQWHADRAARRPKTAKLAINAALRLYVQERLSGAVKSPEGCKIKGPEVVWNGRRSGRRQHRRWASAWSPEQIARRLPVDFPDDKAMRISPEAIYQALYIQGRGALRRELTACLRTGRALRMPRTRRGKGKPFVSSEIMISERPAEVEDRAVPGHWEGDLILGPGSSAIGTLVERTTRFTMPLHLPRMPGYGDGVRMKNGPALAGHGAEAVRYAITRMIITLPEQLRQSLTWDQGAEMAQHANLRIDTGLQIYFCDPQSPWQRGTNENTNGLLRQYFPKGTDLSKHSADDIAAVETSLNARPRKTLGWKTPAEALDRYLRSARNQPVATTVEPALAAAIKTPSSWSARTVVPR
jgi:transposase, IS30 family